MNTGGEAGEQVVRMSLNGIEMAAKITGKGAKELAVLLYTILKEKEKTKGAARLSSMLRSGKELKVFTVKQSDLKTFSKEAKRYGVLYCALKGVKKNPDGLVDVMVRAEDASKINRIVERFELATVDKAAIQKTEPVETGREQSADGLTPEESRQAEALVDELLGNAETPSTEKKEKEKPGQEKKSRKRGKTRQGEVKGQTNARLSEPISEKQRNSDKTSTDRSGERHSVRADLEKIRLERERTKKNQNRRTPDKQKAVIHEQPQKKKRRKAKVR